MGTKESSETRCKYTYKNGQACKNTDAGKGLCFWHDPTQLKESQETSAELEAMARSGQSLEGFALKGANLCGVNLVNRGKREGFDLRNTDLYHANLQDAHLFMANLQGASLMKADLSRANLHYTNLTDANLLGCKLHGAKIENAIWGKSILQERLADRALSEKNPKLALDYYEQAEEIYRHLRIVASKQGLTLTAGNFFYKEMIMRRKQLPRASVKRALSKFVDMTCGYGEKPGNVIVFSVSMILVCCFGYFGFGVQEHGQMIGWRFETSQGQLSDFLSCLYYSVVTFTTLGYGDVVPIGPSRALAAFEAFTGSFTLALFVVVFVKKMTR